MCDPETSVAMLNTDPGVENFPGASAEKISNKNRFECYVIMHLIAELKEQGIDLSSIGIITPYSAQFKTLKDIFDSQKIEVFTLDKCLSITKDCLIISCVKQDNKPEMIKEISRLHIAFPRAKLKLIIIGSKSNLEKIENLKEYFMAIEKSGLEVPINDLVAEHEYAKNHYSIKDMKNLGSNSYYQ